MKITIVLSTFLLITRIAAAQNIIYVYPGTWKHNPVGLEKELSIIPGAFKLEQSYPNPFNPRTTIAFSLPQKSRLRLEIYDTSGRKIRTLINELRSAGIYSVLWNAHNDQGLEVNSGAYFYRLSTASGVETKKMLLVR